MLTMDEDIAALRDEFLNQEFDVELFEIDPVRVAEYALAAGEKGGRFTDPDHEDFQAPATCVPSSSNSSMRVTRKIILPERPVLV